LFDLFWKQAGAEVTDFVVVLRNEAAVRAFAGRVHVSLGTGVSVAAGPIGRSAEADLRAGDGGAAACYTYSMSKGTFPCLQFLVFCS
jgi:lipid-binding SYLF domain-containing protein